MVTRPSSSSLREVAREAPNGTIAVVFGVFTGIALFAVLFPWFPGGQQLDVGARASSDIVSPRDVTYESAVLTGQTRDAAADAIEDVLVLNTEVRERGLAELDRILAAIEAERADATKSASARETAVRGIAGTQLSAKAASTLVAAADTRWSSMQEEVRDALSRTLTGAIAPGEAADALSRAEQFLSPLLTGDEVDALSELLAPLILPTLAVSEERTEALRSEARANTPPVRVSYAAGQTIVSAGAVIDEAAYEAIEQLDIRTGAISASGVAAAAVAALLGGGAFGAHLWVVKPRSLRGARRLSLFALTLLVPAVVAKFSFPLIFPDLDGLYLAHALPIAAGPVVAAVLLDVGSGVMTTIVLAGVVGYFAVAVPSTGGGALSGELDALRIVLATLAASIAGLFAATRAERLQGYLGAGIAAAAAGGLAATVTILLDAQRALDDVLWLAGASATGGILVATVSVGAFVLLSRPFGIITRVELMELVQLNHPLLRRLQDEAPGTFQHSMLVGSLADRAADRIGADALLVRVGAYYHDVGKLHSPGFFVENFGDGPSPHDNLDPLQSSRVIMRHVSAGGDLARKHGLPEAVVAFVEQHHGTRLVAYFYRQAAQVKPDIDPELFRYDGPKPQSRETALVMLADACEASVRASKERTAERIRQIVDGLITERIEEGQFDECPLSLRDLRIVADSFVQSLSAIYHPRVEYPEPTRRELQARRQGDVETADPRAPRVAPPTSVIVDSLDDPLPSEDTPASGADDDEPSVSSRRTRRSRGATGRRAEDASPPDDRRRLSEDDT
ncbi:MAG: HDIG domain-containing protein [Chloroflexi bacterium]|nr:HDIG domain-containing protein [Chloroflexota bacterium]